MRFGDYFTMGLGEVWGRVYGFLVLRQTLGDRKVLVDKHVLT